MRERKKSKGYNSGYDSKRVKNQDRERGKELKAI